ncbi:short-chain dehydrogenase [Pseudoxanthomonas broegbernensis]|uniref:Short-chain dehydrogenase n=1 Tax=Pseudoxanthomonas broegbernensis TaxID=83619 RepID=A0A7V8K6I6_9GAMM|nr:SDR family oxidoreductase [Pseudoxanthomonas broegbernensis]KAF1685925.1 short-chain dehydrogenase [Pseudoxanthomonas broegbernensis]MBB6064155.1 NAD(P)-dependent dehydrogenase (short-subunit alcohol dehydrogenase family) [Pseudoxanthomonas broegbernensis]
MSARLSGKTAIVTGAASGIGAATARLFAAEGARVVGLDRAAQGDPAALAAGVEHVQADVTDQAAVLDAVSAALARHSRIDALVNNAGADVFAEPLDLADADWQRNLDLNLKGAWHLARAVLPAMLAQGAGAIVNIASVHGHKVIPGCFPYNVAKHGLIGLTRALGIQYAARGIRVNSISPGLILVPRIEAWFQREPEARQVQTALLPPKRIGTPDEVAYTAVFLSSDEARFINATDILVDGGRSQVYHD